MRIPNTVIACVRGPLLAASLAGCAAMPAPPEPIDSDPAELDAPLILAAVTSRDDEATLEDARLARADRARRDDEARRERRIEDARARRVAAAPAPVPPSYYYAIACGRG